MVAAAKTETPSSDAAPAAPEAAAPVAGGGIKAWIPTVAAIVLAPAACFAVAQFVLLPQLRQSMTEALQAEAEAASASGPAPSAPAVAAAKSDHGSKDAPAAGTNSYKFENVVVNLAGTMGTRYLKTTFLVTGSANDLSTRFEAARPQLVDVTLSVLSSLSLHDLEEPGAKNVLREKLVNSYNQALGQHVAEQVFFADFVVQ